MSTNTQKNGMLIDKIENGIVIDHMAPGRSMVVMEILNLTGNKILKANKVIAIAINVRSGQQTRKDFLKISNFSLTEEMINKLGLIIPNATLNVISNYTVIEKKKFLVPEEVTGFNCPSSSCITNGHEDVIEKFKVFPSKTKNDHCQLRCTFCDQKFPITQFLDNWTVDWS